MKKIIITIIGILIVGLGSIYLLKKSATRDTVEIVSADQAIAFIQEKNSELKSYPSDNLPPKRIEIKEAENGWYLGFYTEGSGLPGILMAKCYLVTKSGNINATGEFSAKGHAGPNNLDVTTCKDTSVVSENPDTSSQSEQMTARINQKVSSSGITITPLEVVEDSRCPANVNCIWAGTVKIKTNLESPSGKSTQIFELNKTVTTETKSVTMINVAPQTQPNIKIKNADYVFYFEIKER